MNKIGLRHFITPYDECADKLKTDSLQFLFQNNNAIPDVSTVLQLEKLRGKADHLDEKVIEILSERKKLVEQMSQIKKQKNLPIFDPQRWNEILRSRKRSGKEKMLDEELIEKIFEAIHLGNIKSMLSDEE
jgi:chorismate mutase